MASKRVVDWVTGIVIALLLLIAFLLNSCAHYELRENPRVTLAKRVQADSLLYFLFPADTSLYHLFLYELKSDSTEKQQ